MKTKLSTLSALIIAAALSGGFLPQAVFAQDGQSGDQAGTETDTDTDAETEPGTEDAMPPGADPNQQLPENTTPGKLTVQLSGTATTRNETSLQISPQTIDTGLVEIGQSVTETVTILHAGSAEAAPVQINAVQLFGTNPSEYTVDFSGFTTLAPGDELPVEVTFTPASSGKKSAGLRMELEGLTAPVVMTFRGESRYPFTSDLLPSNENLQFGNTLAGQVTKKSITLTNDGEESAPVVNISSFQITGQNANSFSSNFTQTALQPGESLTIVVSLAGGAVGFNQATATIQHDGNNDDIEVNLEGTKVADGSVPIEFSTTKVKGMNLERGTAAQFGPDGKLYVTEMNGLIKVYTIIRQGANNYQATLETTINSVAQTPNHNDDGTPVNIGVRRLVTGINVTGTAANPIIYVASSDPRQAAGPSGNDSGLDTNSGILHRLTKNGNNWVKQDLVRGLPRSEENHVPNGIVVKGNLLYLAMGGHTNQGAPSNNFAFTPEYALSASVLEIDLNAIGNNTYDLPTLDDEDRPGTNDANDPFGGNDGKNQAMLNQNSPVKVYATGYRNPYDLVQATNGKMYTFDNGPNPPWGSAPVGNCTNQVGEGGEFKPDQLHIVSKNAYGGHANPIRGNKNNTFNESNPQSPIVGPAWPGDCNYKSGGAGDGSITTITGSTNGMDEYTASNFFGQMQGDLVVASFNKMVTRIELTANGNGVAGKQVLKNNFGQAPLDIFAQGDNDPFPGTMWVVDILDTTITVLEPSDY